MNSLNWGVEIPYNKIVEKYERINDNKDIYIFFHIATIGRWRDIVKEQIDTIVKSGLYDRCTQILYGCNCKDCPSYLKQFFKGYSKVKPLPGGLIPDKKTYENGTINAMIDFIQDKDCYVLYIHSKGVTGRHPSQEKWRDHMMYWNVKRHLMCTDLLSRGFDTVGVSAINTLVIPIHYAGNFWWTRSDYLKKKSHITDLSYRHSAEWFLLKDYNRGKNVCISNKAFMIPYIHHYEIDDDGKSYNMMIF